MPPRAAKADPRPWQRMLSTRKLNLEDPSPLDVEIEDIAHGLSRVARWNGQTEGDWAFSVAQHSLLVEAICGMLNPKWTEAQRLVALLHDGPEYVIGDLISPFKARMGEGYKVTENRIFDAILMRYSLREAATPALMKRIKQADLAAAYLEAVDLALFDEDEAARFFKPDPRAVTAKAAGDLSLEPMAPNAAKAAFLARFETLGLACRVLTPSPDANRRAIG